MSATIARRVLEVAEELARLASKHSSDLKPGEIGAALERLRVVREEVAASADADAFEREEQTWD